MKKFEVKGKHYTDNKIRIIEAESMEEVYKRLATDFFHIREVVEDVKKEFPCAFVGINQQDKRWKEKFIGYSKSTIGDFGCLLSSICSHSFWACLNLTPDVLAKKFKFTSDGRLLWQSINNANLGIEFVWRYYTKNTKKIIEILHSKRGLCEVEVNYGRGKHWLALTGYRDGKFYAHDPLQKKRVDVEKTYGKITGFAELKVTK